MTDAPTDPDSLRAWMRGHGYRSEALARDLDLSVYTVNKWLTGTRPIRPIVTRALREVGRRRVLPEPFATMAVGPGAAFEAWRVDRGLTKTAIARALPATTKVVGEWARGERALSAIEARALRDYDQEVRRRQPKPRA